ncbi:MAG: type IV toxin-antitoxin system AbiEi family antitoxin domain-containing protein [Nocardioidaceae bacterium]
MQVPEEAHAQGGTFDRAQARAAGWTDSALDHALAAGRLVALRRGQLVVASHLDGLRGAARHEALLHAAIRAQGEGWHAARRSAAVVHRLPMLGPAPATPLLLREHRTRQERSSTRFQRLAALPPEERDLVRGVPVTTLARTVFDIARSEDFRSAMVVADGALRAGLRPDDLAACLARHRGWPGSRAACDVAAFADGRAESPLETLGRVVTRHHDLPVFEPQVQVLLHGEPVARVDGLWREQLLVFEGDRASRLRGGLDPELVARQERIRDCGLDVVRASWDDLYRRHPAWAEQVRRRLADRSGARLRPGVELLSTRVRVVRPPVSDPYLWAA